MIMIKLINKYANNVIMDIIYKIINALNQKLKIVKYHQILIFV